ncbi:hypothetical protein NDU88_005827 [Pleurodeles waltl]|uniref:Peptidase A2 domain-containing protein n=1 Tax=Pleurodeles waltl TaxID=8319 RepID=A0AAV7TWG7_PLEWA|nr:hypothetical protein NDU88_005827 [Pleurodeles waltl]
MINILALSDIADKAKRLKKKLHLCFVGFKSAFDRVDRAILCAYANRLLISCLRRRALFICCVDFVAITTCTRAFSFRLRSKETHATDDESIEDFVTALRKLATSCNFGENLEERIREQFMLECKCDKVREALWAKNDPSLDEVLIIAKQVEHSMACIENLRKSRNVAMDVQALDTKTNNKFQANIRTRLMCFRCGSTTHLANSKDCPALLVTCNKCSKKGYFAKYCKSSSKFKVKVQEIDCNDDRDFVLEIINDVNCVANISCQYPSDFVEVNGTSISMMMDSGAKLSLVSVSDFTKHFNGKVSLLDPDIIPYSYGGKPIELQGYFEATITFRGNMITGKIYVPVIGDTILSWPHQKMLGIILNPNSIPQVLVQNVCSIKDDIMGEFPDVFTSKVGCITGYKHRICHKEGVKPVVCKVRKIPFTLQDKVKSELQRLQSEGIIEEVEAAQWIAPIVVAVKKSGDIRLCVDLRQLNKAVIEDRFPLPNIN